VQLGLNWLRAGSCEHGNGSSGSIKDGEFLDQLSYYQLIRRYVILCCTISVVVLLTIAKTTLRTVQNMDGLQ
jgi:hypothetical protein